MVQNLADKASLLIQVLPYIQKYNNKTIVIKYGGNAMISEALKEAVIKDIVLLSLVGMRIVIVHGGGPEINEMLNRVNKESRFVGGLRYTDPETMTIVQQVLCGKVNKDLVSLINQEGGRAMGLCGMDGSMIGAVKLEEDGLDYGLVGKITKIDPTIINDALDRGYIPVVSTVAQGIDHNSAYNINADTAAAKLAEALSAIKLILLTDVRGLMQDMDDPSSLISEINISQVPRLVEEGVVTGGMIPKVKCCVDAIKGGVNRAHIVDGRVPHSLLIEMLSDAGVGTMITKI